MSKRKRYSPEYKREIVELVRRSKSSCHQVALEIGANPNLLARWVRGPGRRLKVGSERAFHRCATCWGIPGRSSLGRRGVEPLWATCPRPVKG